MIKLDFDIYDLKSDLTKLKLKFNNRYISCLLDTGAYLPIWCDGEEDFLLNFPYARCTNMITLIGGFGKGAEPAKVYVIENFELSDNKNKVLYNKIYIAVIKKDYDFSFILSYSMFKACNIGIHNFTNVNGLHDISPHIIIQFKRNVMYMNPVTKLDTKRKLQILKGISCFYGNTL